MQISDQEAQLLWKEGAEAFRQGRMAEARGRLQRLADGGKANFQTWALIALACRAQKDFGGLETAVDRMLAIQPQALHALIMKGDCRTEGGDEPSAIRFYKAALRQTAGKALPDDMAAEVRRAEAKAAELDRSYHERLEASLSGRGLPSGTRSRRFQQSIDILSGRKQIYFQDPSVYFFPELPQIQYFERERFDWVPQLESATDAIRGELRAMLSDGLDGFRPYVDGGVPRANATNAHLLDSRDWSALFLCENGAKSDAVIERCPRTWEAVQAASLPWIPGSAPTIMFSLLRAGARIEPHYGMQNTRLVCHLPLIVPPDCGFRVGNEVRQWEEGRLLIFDDTIEHEAWNNSAEDRVILIFDIWRPELSEQERREVTAFLGATGTGARG